MHRRAILESNPDFDGMLRFCIQLSVRFLTVGAEAVSAVEASSSPPLFDLCLVCYNALPVTTQLAHSVVYLICFAPFLPFVPPPSSFLGHAARTDSLGLSLTLIRCIPCALCMGAFGFS